MAGINRLGKGSAKPGTLRPADPHRFKTEDFFSLDAEHDPEYLRRIVEVEQLTVNKTGSVLAKGALPVKLQSQPSNSSALRTSIGAAFDKNDALFMRDEAEKARHRELEQRDAELAHFSHLRSKLDQAATLEMYDAGPAPKRTKVAKPKAIVRRMGTKEQQQQKQPGEVQDAEPGGDATAARPNSKSTVGLGTSRDGDGAAATAATGGQTGRGTDAVQAGVNSGNTATASMPGAEVAELFTVKNVIGGKLEGGGAAVLPRYATASAKSACLGLQYDSDDDSEEDE